MTATLKNKRKSDLAELVPSEVQLSGTGEEVVLLCSDGVWEFLTNQECSAEEQPAGSPLCVAPVFWFRLVSSMFSAGALPSDVNQRIHTTTIWF